MFKNQYDRDVTTWSPTGRLFQLEYANEAVNNGSAAVGVKNKDYAVIAALKRSPTAELSSYQEKVFMLDEHLGMSITGLVADGRVLARFIRTECMNYRYMHDTSLPTARLIDTLAEKHQRHTQSSGKRPFGVGLLVVGHDRTGPRLFQTAPSGDVFEYKATAMGLRSQASRTYLEKHYEEFPETTLGELVTHALRALSCATAEGSELNIRNTTIAIVGKEHAFTVYTEEAARKYLDGFQRRAEDVAPALEVDDDEHLVEQPLDLDE